MNKQSYDSTMIKFVKAIDKFWNTNISFVFFTTLVLIVGLIQIILFMTGHPISGVYAKNKGAWIGWTYLVISIPGVMFGFFGEIYTIRIDRKFFVYSVITDTINVFTAILGGMMWTAMMIIAAKVVTVYRYILISKHGEHYEINNKLCNIISAILFLTFMITGLVLINVLPEGTLWWHPESTMLTKYLDVICSTLTFWGIALILTKNKHAFSIFMIGDTLYIIAFILMSQWLTVLQTSLFAIVNVLGYLAWSFKEKHPEIWNKE